MKLFLAVAVVVLTSVSVRAEVTIKNVSWGFRHAQEIAIRPGAFMAMDQWVQAPARKPAALPKIELTLENTGRTAEGIVLRYAVSAKVANIKDTAQQGDWGLPFWISERRVPFIKSGQALKESIDDLRLLTSLSDMYKAGFWPVALKIEVIIKPRLGDASPHPISEKEIPVVWKAQ